MKYINYACLIPLILIANDVLALGGGTGGPPKMDIPEPGTMALMGAGVAAYAIRHFKSKR